MRKVHFFPVSFLFVLANGCEGAEKSPEKEVACTLEAAPVAQPVPGDANGDGHFDVSDGVYYQRSYLAGGPPPVCVEAVDMTPDENPDFGDATAMWFHLGPNRTTEMPKAANCAFPTREVEPACANGLALGIDAPATVNGAAGTATPFEAKVTLTSPMLKVEAWSFTLTASGCSITGSSTNGTIAADREDNPPGKRDGGMAWQEVVSPEELHVLTGLDWRNPTTLPTLEKATAIHQLSLEATPASGCTPCTLSLVPGTPDTGVETVISGGGYRYIPALATATVSVCAG